MSISNPNLADAAKAAPVPPVKPARQDAPLAPPPLFRRIDWVTMAVTTVLIFIGYFLTLAPDVTLEDSGELATGSFYAGVPHPPGYPVWTLYTWVFTVILPFKNPAWRVAVGSAVAGSLACGFLALITSRASSMMIEGIAAFKEIEKRTENAICAVAGFVAGMLMGFNGYMWSQSIIVEVYTLSVLSLMGVLGCVLRWMYAPHQRRYLYFALFLFGVCLTNHMSLLVAAMGIQVAIMCAHRKLGRDLFLVNVLIYVAALVLKARHVLTGFDNNPEIFGLFNVIGILSLAGCVTLTVLTGGLGGEIKAVLIMAVMWCFGASFYFYMPIASMTNPPMNWGYARTVDGFKDALARGQYQAIAPTPGVGRYFQQLATYADGAIDEFSLLCLAIGLVPFIYYRFMQKREKAWMLGLSAIYSCLAFILLYLLNPGSDRQSLALNKVFFTASHVMISMGVGYGVALISATIATSYGLTRRWVLMGAAIGLGFAVYGLEEMIRGAYADSGMSGFRLIFYGVRQAVVEKQNQLQVYAELCLVGISAAFLVLVVCARTRVPMTLMLGLFALMPAHSIVGHWFDNEQRGHLFGFWYGHDMFRPPFKIYPEMERDSVLFGGTDAGRFCPTYMIFCESFVPPKDRTEDATFDRRDVYLITQNALATPPYLNYIRAHYNRSAQVDPPFFQVLFGRSFRFLDDIFGSIGARVEERRRREGVYPKGEIHTPSPAEMNKAIQDYVQDAGERYRAGQLRQGEDIRPDGNGMIHMYGQVSVMLVNAILAKDIFDANPGHEFYVEESFALEWMYPHESPYGIIMKLNRSPLVELAPGMVEKDHQFWSEYSDRLIGNWITYETPVTNICAFAEKLYLRRDFRGFKGDPKFIRDDDAQKNFSKLRGAQAGLYMWRMAHSKTEAERKRMIKEAVFAAKQAFAYCPYNPEAVGRLCVLLVAEGHFDDAAAVARLCLRLDPGDLQIRGMLDQMETLRSAKAMDLPGLLSQATNDVAKGQTNEAVAIVDGIMGTANLDAPSLVTCAQVYVSVGALPKLEPVLTRLVKVVPDSPEAWYDLAGLRAMLDKPGPALEALDRCVTLSQRRLKTKPGARDLLPEIPKDFRFNALRGTPEYQRIVGPQK